MFVLNAYFCRELRFVAILRSKLRFLLRNTGVDSDFTQNFWGKIWRLKSLVWPSVLLSLIWEMCKNTSQLLGTQILLRQTDFTRTLSRQSEQKFAEWRLCFVNFYTSECPPATPSVHQRPTLRPSASDLVSTSERTVSQICETAKIRLFYNGGKRFHWFMSCDDQFLQAQASFRTSESSTSLNYRNCKNK